jgi:hypothetical protein
MSVVVVDDSSFLAQNEDLPNADPAGLPVQEAREAGLDIPDEPLPEVGREVYAQAFLGSLLGVEDLGFVFGDVHVRGGKVNSIWTR